MTSALLALGIALFAGPAASPAPVLPSPPVARREAKVEVVHGDKRTDEYFWLRRKDDAQVRAYLRGELPREALEPAIVRATKLFARRQRTWLKSEKIETVCDLQSVDPPHLA